MIKTNEQLKCKSCFAPLDTTAKGGNIVKCEYCGTDNVLSNEVRQVMAQDTHQFRVALYKAIAHEFSHDDLRDLITRLSGEIPAVYFLDYESISGSTPSMKSLGLVEWCGRRGLLQPLVDVVIAVRPAIVIL